MKKLMIASAAIPLTLAYSSSSEATFSQIPHSQVPHIVSIHNTTSHLYELTQSYDLVVPKGSSGETQLWIPLLFNNDYQSVKSLEFEGNYQVAFITENNLYSAKTLYAKWDKNAEKRLLNVKMAVETKEGESKN